jgi:hypothetical protein
MADPARMGQVHAHMPARLEAMSVPGGAAAPGSFLFPVANYAVHKPKSRGQAFNYGTVMSSLTTTENLRIPV